MGAGAEVGIACTFTCLASSGGKEQQQKGFVLFL